MKKTFIALCLLFISVAGLRAQALSAEDREKALAYLEKTRAGLLAATKGLSEAQWKFKPAPERWSVAEVLEHIASAEDFLMGNIQKNVMKAPPRPEGGEDAKAIDEFVLKVIPDRTSKVKAPEPLVPTNRFGSAADSRTHFETSRAKTVAFLKETKDLREHAVDSPLGKKLDAYQWVLFIAAHSDRHTKQIEEVKADAAFPKS